MRHLHKAPAALVEYGSFELRVKKCQSAWWLVSWRSVGVRPAY
jgi:hypothetical protein